MAIRRSDVVTIALTYGPDVDRLKNIGAAGRCRMRMQGRILTLGPPRPLAPAQGLGRIPNPAGHCCAGSCGAGTSSSSPVPGAS